MLVHMQGIPDVSGGQQHKTWGESSRQTDVRCHTSHPVAPTGGNEFKAAQLKSLQAKGHNRWSFTSPMRKHDCTTSCVKMEAGQLGIRKKWRRRTEFLIMWIKVHLKVSRISISGRIPTLVIWTEQPAHKWQDGICKNTTIFPGNGWCCASLFLVLVTHLLSSSGQRVSCCLLKPRVTEILNRSCRIR